MRQQLLFFGTVSGAETFSRVFPRFDTRKTSPSFRDDPGLGFPDSPLLQKVVGNRVRFPTRTLDWLSGRGLFGFSSTSSRLDGLFLLDRSFPDLLGPGGIRRNRIWVFPGDLGFFGNLGRSRFPFDLVPGLCQRRIFRLYGDPVLLCHSGSGSPGCLRFLCGPQNGFSVFELCRGVFFRKGIPFLCFCQAVILKILMNLFPNGTVQGILRGPTSRLSRLGPGIHYGPGDVFFRRPVRVREIGRGVDRVADRFRRLRSGILHGSICHADVVAGLETVHFPGIFQCLFVEVETGLDPRPHGVPRDPFRVRDRVTGHRFSGVDRVAFRRSAALGQRLQRLRLLLDLIQRQMDGLVHMAFDIQSGRDPGAFDPPFSSDLLGIDSQVFL